MGRGGLNVTLHVTVRRIRRGSAWTHRSDVRVVVRSSSYGSGAGWLYVIAAAVGMGPRSLSLADIAGQVVRAAQPVPAAVPALMLS